jgi:DNA-binding response OmpR family regulator
MLHGQDYEVETAAGGEDAMRLLRSYPCDIVITDWQMPVMDGVTLCRQVRALEPRQHVYLMILTVKNSPQALLAGFAADADDYVVKGTSSAELLARLERGRKLANGRAAYRASHDGPAELPLTDTATGVHPAEEPRSPAADTVHYLNDLALVAEVDCGRNWPAT